MPRRPQRQPVKLTFGFEIEGLFAKTLHKHFIADEAKGDFKHDGSVERIHIWETAQQPVAIDDLLKDSYYTRRRQSDDDDNDLENLGYCYSEYASQVYNSADKMLSGLARFEANKTHWSDNSCGLHLAIGLATDTQRHSRFLKLLCNYKFIKSLQTDDSFCDCIKQRLSTAQRSFYCRAYDSSKRLQSAYLHPVNEKFWFMRFHPNNYAEFRFLTPCKHKLDNVKYLISQINDYLEISTTKIRKVVDEPLKPIKIVLPLEVSKKIIRLSL